MTLSFSQSQKISSLLKNKIRDKLTNYSPETQSMPFHFALLGKDRMALYSFIHSVNTMLGQSIFEKVGEIIAEPYFDIAKSQYSFDGHLNDKVVVEIKNILYELKSGVSLSNEIMETERIKKNTNNNGHLRSSKVDLFVKKGNKEYLFEIKTVKPNIDVFTKTKEKLLEWKAMRYSNDKNTMVKTFICIPYNPEAPNPYSRWTLQGLYDLKNEVLVAEEFWDFLGGKGTYEELLLIFQKIGVELRDEIEEYFKKFK